MKNQIIYITLVLIISLSLGMQAVLASDTNNLGDAKFKMHDCGCTDEESTYQGYAILKESLIDESILQNTAEIDNIYPFSNSLGTNDLPEYFNWKDMYGKDFTTPAKQQANCGSCWDFAAIGVLESVIKIRENVSELDPDLSEQYVLSCLPAAPNTYAQGCNGGQPVNAYKCIMSTETDGNNCNGVTLESCFDYRASHNVDCSEKCDDWQDALVPISDYGLFYNQGVLQNTEQSKNNIKNALIQHGPIATFMDVTDSFIQWGSTNHDPNDYCPYEDRTFNNQLNHAVMIVGWKDDDSILNGGYWICKNSWGTEWGYDGFYNIEYGTHFTGYRVDWVDYDPERFDWGFYYEKPNKPALEGPTSGKSNVEQSYTSVTRDPNNLKLYYLFDWDDGADSGWLGPYESDTECEAEHTWMENGEYTIKVKAKNENGIESDWSEGLIVSLPKTKQEYQTSFQTFLKNIFSRFERIANNIVQLSYTHSEFNHNIFPPLSNKIEMRDGSVSVEWSKTYGGTGDDFIYAVLQASDQGYLLAGTTTSYGCDTTDVLVIKTDFEGTAEWTKTLGGQGAERIWSAIQTKQGNFIIGGGLGKPGTYENKMALWCFDMQGNLIWNTSFQDFGEWGRPTMIENDENEIMVSGWSNEGFLLFKMNMNGEILWENKYDIDGAGGANDICQTNDGGYIMFGEGGSDDYEQWDGIYVKTDSEGTLNWIHRVGGSDAEEGYGLCVDSDGGYVSVGHSRSYGYDLDIYAAKVNDAGEDIWFKTFGGRGMDLALDVTPAYGSGCILVGTTNEQVSLIKLDNDGNQLWSKEVGGSSMDMGKRIARTNDMGYIIAAETYSYGAGGCDFYLIKISPEGDNLAPSIPDISGPSQGKIGETQIFQISSTDPENDDLFYQINWGDGTDDGWFGPFSSGEVIDIEHIWMDTGEYRIQVKGKDIKGYESGWSEPLTVSMPKNKFNVNRCIVDLLIKIRDLVKTHIEKSNDIIPDYPIMTDPLIAPSFAINDNVSLLIGQDLPDEFSWKDHEGQDWTTIAKDQGNCGSCWDFAAIGALEAMVNIQKQDASIDMDLSEQYVLSCLPAAANNYGQGCLGGNPYNAFRYLKDDGAEGNFCNGIISEECFSYYASHDVPCEEKCESWQDELIPILECGYSWPGINFSKSEDIIKSKIYTYGPIAAGIDCTNAFINWGITHNDPDEYYPFIEQTWNNRLNHLIVIVGWKDDPSITNGGYWICKNSWGTEWGYDGFYNIEYGGMFSGAFISWVSIQTDEDNSPPLTPYVPTGPSSGRINEECIFTTSTSDPEDQKVCFRFDWGDGTMSEWSALIESEEVFEISHRWMEKGEYSVRVMAKDEMGATTEWSEPLEIRMPKSHISNNVINYIARMAKITEQF